MSPALLPRSYRREAANLRTQVRPDFICSRIGPQVSEKPKLGVHERAWSGQHFCRGRVCSITITMMRAGARHSPYESDTCAVRFRECQKRQDTHHDIRADLTSVTYFTEQSASLHLLYTGGGYTQVTEGGVDFRRVVRFDPQNLRSKRSP